LIRQISNVPPEEFSDFKKNILHILSPIKYMVEGDVLPSIARLVVLPWFDTLSNPRLKGQVLEALRAALTPVCHFCSHF